MMRLPKNAAESSCGDIDIDIKASSHDLPHPRSYECQQSIYSAAQRSLAAAATNPRPNAPISGLFAAPAKMKGLTAVFTGIQSTETEKLLPRRYSDGGEMPN